MSLSVDADNRGTPGVQAILDGYRQWTEDNALQSGTGLPMSRYPHQGDTVMMDPRGCELSFRLCFYSKLYPELARTHYDQYVKHFWLDRDTFSGFAEWQGGQTWFMDADSGPIFDGLGMAATALALCPSRLLGDHDRTRVLIDQLQSVQPLILAADYMQKQNWAPITKELAMITYSSEYETGFLFGDAMLFFILHW